MSGTIGNKSGEKEIGLLGEDNGGELWLIGEHNKGEIGLIGR